jgi:hypothetical protein
LLRNLKKNLPGSIGSFIKTLLFTPKHVTIFNSRQPLGRAKITLSGFKTLQNQRVDLNAKHQTFIFVHFLNKEIAWLNQAKQQQDVENLPM